MSPKEFRQQLNQAIMYLNRFDETQEIGDIYRAGSIIRAINESIITIEI